MKNGQQCNFSKLQFFKCTFTVISLHIFAVHITFEGKGHASATYLLFQNQGPGKVYPEHSSASQIRMSRNYLLHLIHIGSRCPTSGHGLVGPQSRFTT